MPIVGFAELSLLGGGHSWSSDLVQEPAAGPGGAVDCLESTHWTQALYLAWAEVLGAYLADPGVGGYQLPSQHFD